MILNLKVSYTVWKQLAQNHSWPTYHLVDGAETRDVWTGNEEHVYRSYVDGSDFTDWQTNFETASVLTDLPDDAEALIVGLSNVLPPKVQQDGTPQYALGTRIGKEAIYATHNFCDETSWYSESVRVVEQTLTDSGDGLTWTSPDPCWVDMFSGKVFDDDGLRGDQPIFEPASPHEYKILVESSGDGGTTWDIERQHPPFETTGGDYLVDFAAGTITFDSTRAGKDLRATYSRKGTSGWVLRPVDGRVLTVEKAEIQFSADIDFDAILVMRAKGWVEQFAPDVWDQVSPSGDLWYPSGTGGPPAEGSEGDLYYDSAAPQLYAYVTAYGGWIPLPAGPLPAGYLVDLNETLYKTMAQMLDESVGTFPEFLSIGGSRAIGQPLHILQFHYGMAKLVFSSLGMQLYIGLGKYTVDANSDFSVVEHSAGFGGTRATGTFYMPSHRDPGPTQAMLELTAT